MCRIRETSISILTKLDIRDTNMFMSNFGGTRMENAILEDDKKSGTINII